MLRKLKCAAAVLAAAGLAVSAMANVSMQTTQDSVIITERGPRLVINDKPLFISGINIAWRDFAKDVGPDPITSSQLGQFRNWFEQISVAGGNAVRWWLHTDAQHSPLMNMTTGAVTGLSPATIPNMRAVLDLAYEYGIVVSMCLFSFDLLQNDGNKTQAQMARNHLFLTVPENLDTYIDNALVPILDAIGNHPAVMVWEVFNEPEGMSEGYGWATQRINHDHVIRFTARIAGEVRRRTNKMASTGIHNFHNYVSLYTNARLTAIDPDGWLDFYMAHHYPEYESREQSPFTQHADHWGFDRPVLIGEFPAQDMGPGGYNYGSWLQNNPISIIEAYDWAYQNGYLGAMSWSITESNSAKFGTLATTLPALEYMAEKYDDIRIRDDITIDVPEGDLVMKVVFDAHPVGEENEVLLKKEVTFNPATATTLSFDFYIDAASGSNFVMDVVLQGTDWSWNDVRLNTANITKGSWETVTIPVSNFDASSVYAIFFKIVATGTPFSGTFYFDNVKVDDTVISDFDELYSEWEAANGDVAISLVTRASLSSIRHHGRNVAGSRLAPQVSLRGGALHVRNIADTDMRVRLFDVRGRAVANFTATRGDNRFSLTNSRIPAGRYLVVTDINGRRVGTTAIMVR